MIVATRRRRSVPRSSPRGTAFLRFLGWVVAVILLGLVAMAGLGFYWMHKAKEAGLNPDLIRKNRDLGTAEVAVIRRGDVRVLSRNDAAGTMVVRDKKTGKTTSLKFDPSTKSMVDVDEHSKQAAVQAMETSAISETKPPDTTQPPASSGNGSSWLPIYPGTSAQTTVSHDETGGERGSYVFVTMDAAEKVLSYYSEQLTTAGMKVSTAPAPDGTSISAVEESKGRSVQVTISKASDGTRVSLSYEEKKMAGKASLGAS